MLQAVDGDVGRALGEVGDFGVRATGVLRGRAAGGHRGGLRDRHDCALAVGDDRLRRIEDGRMPIVGVADEHDLAVGLHCERAGGVVDQVRGEADDAVDEGARGRVASDEHRLRAAEAGDEDGAVGVERHRRRAAGARRAVRRPGDLTLRDAAIAERGVHGAVEVVADERHRAACGAADDDLAVGLDDHRNAVVLARERGADGVAGAVEVGVDQPVSQRSRRNGETAEGEGQGGRNCAPPSSPSVHRLGHASLLEPQLTGVERSPGERAASPSNPALPPTPTPEGPRVRWTLVWVG